MALVEKPAPGCGPGDGLSFPQQPLGLVDALVQEIRPVQVIRTAVSG